MSRTCLATTKLATMIRAAGLTQAQVCRQTGIKAADLSRWVNGKRRVSKVGATLLSELLGTTPNELGWDPEELPDRALVDLLSATRRIAALEQRTQMLSAAAVSVCESLARAEQALYDARQAVRDAIREGS